MAQVERGVGRKVQTEIAIEWHHRLRLEQMRRERQGQPVSIEALVYEAIGQFIGQCPSADSVEEPVS